MQLDRTVHFASRSLHHLQNGFTVLHKADSVYDLHDDSADLHTQGAVHDMPPGLRNAYCLPDKMRSSTGVCDDDSLRATSGVPHSSELQ